MEVIGQHLMLRVANFVYNSKADTWITDNSLTGIEEYLKQIG